MKIVPQKFSEINFQPIKREIWFWIGFGIALFGIGKLLDTSAFIFINDHLRTYQLDIFSIFLTEHLIWAIFIVFAVITGYRIWTNPDHHTKLIPALFSVITAGIFAFVAKSIFNVHRPFTTFHFVPVVMTPSLSFPSAHAALAFSLFIPFYRISKPIGISWMLFALLIGFARVYQNVHYPSDIAGGIFLGGIVGAFFSHPEIKKMLNILWQQLEFRRQSFHFAAGFLSVFAHWVGIIRLRELAILLFFGLVISFVSQKKKMPFISQMLHLFDRPRDKNFPGKGAFYFLLGICLTFLFFQGENIHIAYAAILILSVGDSLNHLFGTKMSPYLRLPWNKRKHVPGLLFGIACGTIAAQFFVPLSSAIIATSLALIFESIPFQFGKFYIDDNILVPLIAGSVMLALG